MHSVTSILLFAVLATLALAAPTQKRNLNKRSFSVPRIRQQSYVRNPARAIAHAYHKHGWQSPFDLPQFPDFPSSSGSASPAASSASSSASSAGSHHYHGQGGQWNQSSTATSAASSPYSTSTGQAASVSATSSNGAAEDKAVGSQTGETTATSAAEGAEYVCPVTIGTQTLNLVSLATL